jgi:hypothetical protein
MADCRCCECLNFYPKCQYEDDYSTKTNYQDLVASCPYFETIKHEITPEELEGILSLTIKRDQAIKLILFLTLLLTYTEAEQVNHIISAGTTLGKTYVTSELLWFFPQDDIIKLDGASKTAFIHKSTALFVDKRTFEPFDPIVLPKRKDFPLDASGKAEYQDAINDYFERMKERKEFGVSFLDYSRKIIWLPDMPNVELLKTVRSLLSHDSKFCNYSITRGDNLKTKEVLIKGFPSWIFTTTYTEIDPQDISRNFLHTPEDSEEKIKEAIDLIARKKSDENFQKWYESESIRVKLKTRVMLIKNVNVEKIFAPNEIMENLKNWMLEKAKLKPKIMRDFPRVISIAEGYAMLNFPMRKRSEDGKVLYVSEADAEVAKKLYSLILESNELGLTPECYELFLNVVTPLCNNEVGATLSEIHHKYFGWKRRACSESRLKGMLKNLETGGLITCDKSKKTYHWILVKTTEEEKLQDQKLDDFKEGAS